MTNNSHESPEQFTPLDGEFLHTAPDPILEPWHDELQRLEELVPTGHDIAWTGHDAEGDAHEVEVAVEHGVDEHGKKIKKVVITAGVLASFAAVGVTAYRKGLIGPKARRSNG